MVINMIVCKVCNYNPATENGMCPICSFKNGSKDSAILSDNPKDYQKDLSFQIGNAVCPPVAKAIANKILEIENNE